MCSSDLGAPFFVFVGSGGSYARRAIAAGLGASIPIALLLAYNLSSTGHLFHPAYDYLYRTEYVGYLPPEHCLYPQDFCASLSIDRSLGIEDVRHVPLNALIMLGWLPVVQPECGFQLLDPACPPVRPDEIGMSILLTSPAYLLALPLVLRRRSRRLVLGATLAVAAIALLNLMHFSQGWVQFGYRFSNDFAPFVLVLVTRAIGSQGVRPLTVALVGASVLINAWGVYWGLALGW